MSPPNGTPSLVDQWIARARNNPVTAALILIALTLGGIASALKAYKEVKDFFSPSEQVTVTFQGANPAEPRTAMVLIRNEGAETAVVQNLVFRILLKTRVGLKTGVGVLFPAGLTKSIGSGQSDALKLTPAAFGMFPTTETTNKDFFDFFAKLGQGGDVDPDVFRRHCSMLRGFLQTDP